ncbi:hypothetical protein GCM10009563_29540 [Subtercola frigoramans]
MSWERLVCQLWQASTTLAKAAELGLGFEGVVLGTGVIDGVAAGGADDGCGLEVAEAVDVDDVGDGWMAALVHPVTRASVANSAAPENDRTRPSLIPTPPS